MHQWQEGHWLHVHSHIVRDAMYQRCLGLDGSEDLVSFHGLFSDQRKKEDRDDAATFTLPPPALSGSGSKGTSQPLGAPGKLLLG